MTIGNKTMSDIQISDTLVSVSVPFDSACQVDSLEFFQLLDSCSRLHNLGAVATKDYVAFYYFEDEEIHDVGFIDNDLKCFRC